MPNIFTILMKDKFEYTNNIYLQSEWLQLLDMLFDELKDETKK